MVASDSVYTYHVAVSVIVWRRDVPQLTRLKAVGFLSNGLFLSVSAVNGLIYLSNGAEVATGAMFILLSMLAVSFSSLAILDWLLTIDW